jgi:hypothetical protein
VARSSYSSASRRPTAQPCSATQLSFHKKKKTLPGYGAGAAGGSRQVSSPASSTQMRGRAPRCVGGRRLAAAERWPVWRAQQAGRAAPHGAGATHLASSSTSRTATHKRLPVPGRVRLLRCVGQRLVHSSGGAPRSQLECMPPSSSEAVPAIGLVAGSVQFTQPACSGNPGVLAWQARPGRGVLQQTVLRITYILPLC